MNDVNYVKETFKSWHKAHNWLIHVYPNQIHKLNHELTGIKAITYEERLGGSGKTESMRISIINDKIVKLEKYKKHCESICSTCESLLSDVKPQYRDIFEYSFKYNSNVSYVSYKTSYSQSRIYEIIDGESERLSRE